MSDVRLPVARGESLEPFDPVEIGPDGLVRRAKGPSLLHAMRAGVSQVDPILVVLSCAECGVELGPFAYAHLCPGGRAT